VVTSLDTPPEARKRVTSRQKKPRPKPLRRPKAFQVNNDVLDDARAQQVNGHFAGPRRSVCKPLEEGSGTQTSSQERKPTSVVKINTRQEKTESDYFRSNNLSRGREGEKNQHDNRHVKEGRHQYRSMQDLIHGKDTTHEGLRHCDNNFDSATDYDDDVQCSPEKDRRPQAKPHGQQEVVDLLDDEQDTTPSSCTDEKNRKEEPLSSMHISMMEENSENRNKKQEKQQQHHGNIQSNAARKRPRPSSATRNSIVNPRGSSVESDETHRNLSFTKIQKSRVAYGGKGGGRNTSACPVVAGLSITGGDNFGESIIPQFTFLAGCCPLVFYIYLIQFFACFLSNF
jgi:hypothetical protein